MEELHGKSAIVIAAFAGVMIKLLLFRPPKPIDWVVSCVAATVLAWFLTHPAIKFLALDADYVELVALVIGAVGDEVAQQTLFGIKRGQIPFIGGMQLGNFGIGQDQGYRPPPYDPPTQYEPRQRRQRPTYEDEEEPQIDIGPRMDKPLPKKKPVGYTGNYRPHEESDDQLDPP